MRLRHQHPLPSPTSPRAMVGSPVGAVGYTGLNAKPLEAKITRSVPRKAWPQENSRRVRFLPSQARQNVGHELPRAKAECYAMHKVRWGFARTCSQCQTFHFSAWRSSKGSQSPMGPYGRSSLWAGFYGSCSTLVTLWQLASVGKQATWSCCCHSSTR